LYSRIIPYEEGFCCLTLVPDAFSAPPSGFTLLKLPHGFWRRTQATPAASRCFGAPPATGHSFSANSATIPAKRQKPAPRFIWVPEDAGSVELQGCLLMGEIDGYF
jgi:hypothetical protein